MGNSASNPTGVILLIIIVGIVIAFIGAMIHGIKKGAKQGKEFREKVIRQNEQLKTMVNNANDDSSEQLRKLKSLLDDGIISQAEFDAKKKQILGI